jgi:hypothetical protein
MAIKFLSELNPSEGVIKKTKTEILAWTPSEGQIAYNTTDNSLCFYNGSIWKVLSSTQLYG